MNIRDRIKRNEGTGPTRDGRFFPYLCPAGKITIAWGFNLDDNGISREIAEMLLDETLTAAVFDIEALFWGIPLTDARKAALVDMRFQLGAAGFRAFKGMIAAIRVQDWRTAAIECLDSAYARQCPVRAQENAADLESG